MIHFIKLIPFYPKELGVKIHYNAFFYKDIQDTVKYGFVDIADDFPRPAKRPPLNRKMDISVCT